MSCQEVREFLGAYVDKELDVITASPFDRHLTECAACRTKYEQYRDVHDTIRAHMEYFQAPEDLEKKLRAQLHPSGERKDTQAQREWFSGWRAWVLATASMAAVLLLALVLLQIARRPSTSEILAQQVVSSHIRSLLANHISDVISSDQHTVKPWFSGRLDFAPVVKDLAPEGFPLVGGRLDYLDDRPVAALVYKRRQHTINLFLWPSRGSDSGPRTLSIRGYNLVYWTHAHMAFWAISDVNAADLGQFAHDLGS